VISDIVKNDFFWFPHWFPHGLSDDLPMSPILDATLMPPSSHACDSTAWMGEPPALPRPGDDAGGFKKLV
jgi:hypothetical protein